MNIDEIHQANRAGWNQGAEAYEADLVDRVEFLRAGGKEFHYIPCLNDEPAWVAALGELAQRHLAGWPTQEAPDTDALEKSALRAQAMGAKR